MREIRKSIDIAAGPDAVWRLLTRLGEYADWNPFYRWALGAVENGAAIRLYATPPGSRPFTFRPRVAALRPEKEMLWKGPLRPFGLLRGEQSFHLRTIEGGGTRLEQRMRVGGALFLFGGDDALERIGAGMDGMNRAARDRLEGR